MPLIKKYKSRLLKIILRGYNILNRTNRLKQTNIIFEKFGIEKCIRGNNFSELIFGSAKSHGEIVIRQFLLVKLENYLRKATLFSSGLKKELLIFPAPNVWLDIMNDHGLRLYKIPSIISWYGLVFIYLNYGIYTIIKNIILSFKDINSDKERIYGKYSFFDGLSKNNLPSFFKYKSYNVVSWYLQWGNKFTPLDTICHTVHSNNLPERYGEIKIQTIKSPIILPKSIFLILQYAIWGFAASLLSIYDLLRGRWWHALILAEASKRALINIAKKDSLARDYLFHNSSWIYRPLWTYDAEKKGSRILFYFYSTNCQPLKYDGRVRVAPFGYESMSWPHYLVWDKEQAQFINSVIKIKSTIDTVGPIWFADTTKSLPILPKRSVIVFDVQPVRDSFYKTLVVEFDYFVPKIINKFLFDIHEELKNNNYFMILKRKRKIGKLAHPSYIDTLSKLNQSDKFLEVDSEISAIRLIEKSIAVISFPFTSTAIIARDANIPSIYYDSNKILDKNDPAAHGIEVISGPNELKVWLNNLYLK